MSNLIENITAGGHSLRESIIELTGCDPLEYAEFSWSNGELTCDTCDGHDSTCMVDLGDTGDNAERICWDCFYEKTR